MDDQVVAQLTAVQDRLAKAEKEGPGVFAKALSEVPRGIGVHEIDLDRVITRVTAEEARLLGYTVDQMVGRPSWEFAVMEGASQRAAEQKMKGAKELKPFVRTLKRGDGSAVPMLLLDRQRLSADGKVIGMRTVMIETKLEY